MPLNYFVLINGKQWTHGMRKKKVVKIMKNIRNIEKESNFII